MVAAGVATTCDCGVRPVSVTSTAVGPWRAAARMVIGGPHCDSCAARVEHALLAVDGVVHARVRRASGIATVLYDPTRATQRDLLAAVVRAGGDGVHHYHGLFLY